MFETDVFHRSPLIIRRQLNAVCTSSHIIGSLEVVFNLKNNITKCNEGQTAINIVWRFKNQAKLKMRMKNTIAFN